MPSPGTGNHLRTLTSRKALAFRVGPRKAKYIAWQLEKPVPRTEEMAGNLEL
jgi:hypothetical protein